MYTPTRQEFLRQAAKGNLIPVYREVVRDSDTPVSAFAKLKGAYSFLLESVVGGEKWAAYSFIGVQPHAHFRWKAREQRLVWLDAEGAPKATETQEGIDLAQALSELMARFRPVAQPGLPRFFGGAVGYVGYDAVRSFERLPQTLPDDLDLPESSFVITDTLVIFDNVRQTLKIVANAYLDRDTPGDVAYDAACARIERIVERLERPAENLRTLPVPSVALELPAMRASVSEQEFCAAVIRAKEYILAGDAFQIVLSQRFEVERRGLDPFDVYRALRVLNPSPYLFHLSLPEASVTGASPEVMVRLEGSDVELRPIAGTRWRGTSALEDARLGQELLGDPKERSEHVMLVDLGRNDLGRVAEVGTVEVTELMAIERYSHVMHIVSNVRARLAQGLGAMDVLRATFPAGTLTGAPKIRAMEIIEELEPFRRGIYGGAVGYISFTGNLDLAIAIRTLVTKNDKVYVQAGAGLVAGSDPASEYQECLNKARAVLQALAMAGARN